MMTTIYKDPERYKKSYWEKIPGVYYAGDVARRDEDGYYWIMGRADDVMNIAGHRIGTAGWKAPWWPTAAWPRPPSSASRQDQGRGGQGLPGAARRLAKDFETTEELIAALRAHLRRELGPVAVVKSSSSAKPCRAPEAAKSCAACCAPRNWARTPATPPPWRIWIRHNRGGGSAFAFVASCGTLEQTPLIPGAPTGPGGRHAHGPHGPAPATPPGR